jgi:hypothetical protein
MYSMVNNSDGDIPRIAKDLSKSGVYFKPVFKGEYIKEIKGFNPKMAKAQ